MNLNPEQHEGHRMNSTTSTTLRDYFALYERSLTYKDAVLEENHTSHGDSRMVVSAPAESQFSSGVKLIIPNTMEAT